MSLFGRQVIASITSAAGVGKAFPGLRTTFDVKMSKSSTPNTGVFEIWNPAPNSIALAQAPGAVVRCAVGYDVPRQIFAGNPIKSGVSLEYRGPDTVLCIEAQDGGTAYQTARVSVSYGTQTSAQQVYDEVFAQMGIPAGTVRIPPEVVFPQGVVLAGPARDVLDKLAIMCGSEWFLRDGAIQFIGVGEDTGETAILFSLDTGLVGSPKRKDGTIEVTALLAPTMRPGKLFQVESRDVNGLYVAGDVAFRGDSGWATEFYVVASGTPR